MSYETALKIFENINVSKNLSTKNQLFESAIREDRIRTEWYFMT